MTYAKLNSETSIRRDAPRSAVIDGAFVCGQLPADYLASLGWFPLDEAARPGADPAPGTHWETRYAVSDGRIAQSWAEVADPPAPPRSLSKRKLYLALKELGVWEAVRGYMEAAGVWEDFSLATTLDEDDPLIADAVQALKVQLGLSDAQVEQILAASAAEG